MKHAPPVPCEAGGPVPAPLNLFADLPWHPEAEVFTELARREGLRIERIVSAGQASPPDSWYDQAWDEWVLLLEGRAVLAFGNGERRELGPGDGLMIPAHCRHRVEWTQPGVRTVWLAVHHGRAVPG